MSKHNLGDKALSILAFAAYHSLESGEVVGEIVVDDGNGHTANQEGLTELESEGLVEVNGARARFTEDGAKELGSVIEALKAS